MDVLGLDIGGANLKAAHTQGIAKTEPFALWKAPQELATRLHKLIAQFPPFDEIAVTMTGELCDCFQTKREGVAAILASVAQVAERKPVRVWCGARRFMTMESACQDWLGVASANWHAQASMFGMFLGNQPAVLIDIGSTTTDVVPIVDGKPAHRGWTDPERLQTRELCYSGVRRTPVCAVLSGPYAAEFFATMHDVYLHLLEFDEDENDLDTADQRPATKINARARLARMLCGDCMTVTPAQIDTLANQAKAAQVRKIGRCVETVVSAMTQPAQLLIFAGSGAFLEDAILETCDFLPKNKVFSVERQVNNDISTAMCAYAVAVLALEFAEQA